jgi:hypothetical protein
VLRHLTAGLSVNEQHLAISVKKEYDDPRKCSGFEHDAGFLVPYSGKTVTNNKKPGDYSEIKHLK